MMKQFLIFSLFLSLFSCGNKAAKDILSVKQMQEIQWDLMRADEMVEFYHAADSLYHTKEKREEYYDRIFSLHHTSKEAFTRSLNYYTARPKELKLILDSVEARVERQSNGDTVKTAKDTMAFMKDTLKLPRAVDSLKRKKGLKVH